MDLQNDKPADVGTVVEIQNGFAIVEYSRSDACNTCKLKPFCFQRGGDVNTLTMKNELNVKKGDKIQFEISPQMRILSSFLVFILPIIFMIGSYFLCKSAIGLSESISIIVSLVSIAVAFILVKIIDGQIKKKAMIQPKMVALVSPENEK
ncbi:MAG: SoxR reducing system RseC family protein [Candidatus Celaenobacter antarcticus]|nr:SoxR reducing system RseC family protein [Candidatus Celaenobacter antarcticus]